MSHKWIKTMAKSSLRTYSRYTHDALRLFASLIKIARKQKKLTTLEVSERAGISRGLLQRIEKGDTGCEIGVFFEVATILGVELFASDEGKLSSYLASAEEKLTLLPKIVRKKVKKVDDDF